MLAGKAGLSKFTSVSCRTKLSFRKSDVPGVTAIGKLVFTSGNKTGLGRRPLETIEERLTQSQLESDSRGLTLNFANSSLGA